MDFDVVNDNEQIAYFTFGSAPVSGSIKVQPGYTVKVGGIVQRVGSTVPLSNDVVLEIAPGDTIAGLDVQNFGAGKFLISLGNTISQTDNTNFNYDSGVDSEVRWDKIEASIYSNKTSYLDLSAQDFLGIGLTVKDLSDPHLTVLHNTSGDFQAEFDDIVKTTLGTITTGSPYNDFALVPAKSGDPKSVGISVPYGSGAGVKTEDALRIVSPATIDPHYYSAYSPVIHVLNDYINDAHKNMGTIWVTDHYNGVAGQKGSIANQYHAQDLDFKTSFDRNHDLIMVSEARPGGIGSGYTITIQAADMLSEVLNLNTKFTVTHGKTTLTETPGANDVFSKAVTDIAAGFDFGFVDGSGIVPGVKINKAAATYKQVSQNPTIGTAAWYSKDVTIYDAFSKANLDGYYNIYAAELLKFGNAYGFGVEDEFPGIQLDPTDPNDTLLITIAPDTKDDTLIPCFAEGTRIATPDGCRAVEELAAGDRVTTADGGVHAIVWIGHRRVDCLRHARPAAVMPIRIQAHAFGPARPTRDLVLSPDHAVLAEGVLIPVKHLANGTTIHSLDVATVTYFHLELAQHGALLAEGLPCESYLDTGDRNAFAGGAVTDMHPAWGSSGRDVTLVMDALGCAPLRVAGPEVDRVRALLAARTAEHLLAAAL